MTTNGIITYYHRQVGFINIRSDRQRGLLDVFVLLIIHVYE